MKRFLLSCLLAVTLSNLSAQRYLTEVFSNITIDSNVVYGQNYDYYTGFSQLNNMTMDVYHPTGDTVTNRPVIVWMHAGSFLPESVTGYNWANRYQNCIVELCKRFARMGYVAVSLGYRIGWNPGGDLETRSKTIIEAVYRGMQDSKTCIRYFRNNYSTGNSWGIDPNRIVLGGTNSGAYIALAAGNLNKPSEIVLAKFLDQFGQSFIDTTKLGNFDGFGGTQNHDNYPGVSSAFRCSVPLGGAVGDTTWVESGEPPVIAFHGVLEETTPFNTATVITSTGQPVVEVSGAGDYVPVYAAKGNQAGFGVGQLVQGPPNYQNSQMTQPIEGLYPFYGQQFEPWSWYNGSNPAINPSASQAKAMLYIDTIVWYAAPRLYKLMIDPTYVDPNGVSEQQQLESSTTVYPVPAKQNLQITNSEWKIEAVRVLDLQGRELQLHTFPRTHTQQIDVSQLPAGSYLLSILLEGGKRISKPVVVVAD